jgi:hypothetical protein
MDWFETLTGFRETGYADTRERLSVADGRLSSSANGASYGIGQLELVSLQALRTRMQRDEERAGRLKVSLVSGDVRQMHRSLENAGALFQVASQFNLLEMTHNTVSPEQGVTRYQHDHTQGPACAIACGAATIYRNYFVPVGDAEGQTAERQLDGLADIGAALSRPLGCPIDALWTMQNGYALASSQGLSMISEHLRSLSPEEIDQLRGQLRIGLLSDAEVTEAAASARPLVSQAFCSALPVAYTKVPAAGWAPFARLVLEAAYEATLCAAALNLRRGSSNVVFLTLLGGGVFGNPTSWIYAAIQRALDLVAGYDLDVRIVSYERPEPGLVAAFGR